MANPPTLRIPEIYRGLSLHLSSANPQVDLAYRGWIGSILTALFIREFPAVGLLLYISKSIYYQGFKFWFMKINGGPVPKPKGAVSFQS